MDHAPTFSFYTELMKLCIEFKPKNVLEIGTGWAISGSAFLESGCETLDTIDPNHAAAYGRQAIAELDDHISKGQIVTPLTARAENICPDLISEGKEYDLIFIDGSHNYEHVVVDLRYALQLVKEGGKIILDDYFHINNYAPPKGPEHFYGVARAAAEVLIGTKHKIEVIPTETNGFLVIHL
jgi:predicted O-methyltransferase YrrM